MRGARHLERIAAGGPAEGLVCTLLAAAAVRRPLTFVARQVTSAPGPRAYRLRSAPARVVVRHRSTDIWAMRDIFADDEYEPPRQVVEALGARRPLRVLDLGGGSGLFGAWVLGRLDATLVSFEPDPTSAWVLRCCIAANRAQESWTVVDACAGARDGQVAFVARGDWASHVADGREEGTTVAEQRDVLPMMGGFDLVKMDIEGGEWPILLDERLADAAVPVLVLEYHAFSAPGGEPPRDAALRRLRALGYSCLVAGEGEEDQGLMWAWREPPGS